MLSLPPFFFANAASNIIGTPPAALPGVNFTARGGNVDGPQVAVIGAINFDVHYLKIGIGGINFTAGNTCALADILIDPAGGTSWSSFINDLLCGYSPTPAAGTVPISVWYHFPIYIPAGASLGIQARSANTGNTASGRCVVEAYGNPSRPDMWWCGSSVESLGITAASSDGTRHTPGNSGAFSSWASLGTTTTGRYGCIQFGLNGSDATAAAIGYTWQIGYGSTQLRGSTNIYAAVSTAESISRTNINNGPIWCDIAPGTQMQVRGTASGTAEQFGVALYGVY